MTNPDNIVRVRARNGGRASVYEANGWAQSYTSGLLDGTGVIQNTSANMNVLVGGSATNPDVLLAENPNGYKIALDIVGQQAIAVTAPASNKRITAIVAYTDDLSLSTTQDTVTGSPASCGLIAVNGTAASSPSAPTDTQIRNAITSDGATGSQAAYCVIATIEIASGTTAITDSLITINRAQIGSSNIDFATFAGCTEPWEKFSGTKNSVGSTAVETKSYTIPNSGLYEVYIWASNGSGSSKGRVSVFCYQNNNSIMDVGAWSITAYSGNNFAECSIIRVFWFEKGDVISQKIKNENITVNTDWRLYLKRIY